MSAEDKQYSNEVTTDMTEKDQKLKQSPECEKALLEPNSYLEELLHQANADYEKKLEDHEQEKYSLEMKLEACKDLNARMESWYGDETKALMADHKHQMESLSSTHKAELDALKLKIVELQKDVDESALFNHQQTVKLEKQQETISELKLSQQTRINNESLTPELAELISENESLQVALKCASEESDAMENNVEHLKFNLGEVEKSLVFYRDAKEYAEAEVKRLSEALELCRQDNRELSQELDDLRSQPQDPNSKGNSLFAEVEDKRIQAEKRLISVQVKMKCTERKYLQQVNYAMKLKTQVAQLLQTGGKSADRDYIDRLERSLADSRSDAQCLMGKVAELEGKLANKSSNVLLEKKKDELQDDDFVTFLENLLKRKDVEVAQLHDELQKCRMHLMAETRNVTEANQAIHTARTEADKLRAQCIKQRMEIVKMKLKCGEDVQGKRSIRPGKTEKIPMDHPANPQKNTEENKENLTVGEDLTSTDQCQNETKDKCVNNETSIEMRTPMHANKRELTDSRNPNSSDCPAECKQQ